MSPFDGSSRNKAWETPRGLKIFGGPGASGTRLTDNRIHFLRSYEAENVNHPLLKDWYKNKLVAYNNELIEISGCDMTQIYGSGANRSDRAIRQEMEQIGFTKEVLERWGMLEGEEEEDLIDDFEPIFM